MGYGHSIRGTTLTPVAWFGDHIGLVIAVALVGATLALALWRLHARRSQSELSSGVATVFLAFMAIAVPTGWALWWDGVTGWAFWWAAFVALTAAALASTEWLRASLRWFAVLAIVALSALLLRLGSSDVDAARCAEVRTLATDVTNLDKEKTHLVGAAKTSAEEARNDLSTMIQEQKGSPGLLTPAQNLVTALDSGNGDALKVATTALDAAYRPNEATREDTGLVAAADSAVAATRALTALDAVERPPAVAALDKEACGARPRLVSDVELSKARSATAAFRSSLLPTEVNIAAAKSLAAAEDEATARLARGEADEGTAWVSRIELGATVAGAAALSWLPGSPEPDKWFWVVVAVLLLGAWWLVERRSASMVAGPVSVTFQGAEIGEADKGKQPTKDAQQSVFVTALTKNLREPGATPGSQSSSPLTDLEGVVSAADPSKLLTAIIAVLKKVMSSPRGSTVSAQVLAPLPGDSRWRIFVVVADAATGKSVASKEVPNDSAAEACRVAGYWAAATVLSSSPRIPVWARWSPATAHAFAAYDSASEPTVEALRLALREAPASSLVLHKLADQLSLAGKYASAGSFTRGRLWSTRLTTLRSTDWQPQWRLSHGRGLTGMTFHTRGGLRSRTCSTVLLSEPESQRESTGRQRRRSRTQALLCWRLNSSSASTECFNPARWRSDTSAATSGMLSGR